MSLWNNRTTILEVFVHLSRLSIHQFVLGKFSNKCFHFCSCTYYTFYVLKITEFFWKCFCEVILCWHYILPQFVVFDFNSRAFYFYKIGTSWSEPLFIMIRSRQQHTECFFVHNFRQIARRNWRNTGIEFTSYIPSCTIENIMSSLFSLDNIISAEAAFHAVVVFLCHEVEGL